MAHAISVSDLGSLSKADRDRALDALAREAMAPMNGQAVVIQAKIQGYEARYEITSEQLRDRLRADPGAETKDIANWLFWLRLRALSRGR